MEITATIRNNGPANDITVSTNQSIRAIGIPPKPDGRGSSVNGGELLLLAIATCCCNDIYREAARRNIQVSLVEVTAKGMFAREAEAGTDIHYTVNVEAPGTPDEEITALIQYVDTIAEIHQTIRNGTVVRLAGN